MYLLEFLERVAKGTKPIKKARRKTFGQATARLQQASSAAVSVMMKPAGAARLVHSFTNSILNNRSASARRSRSAQLT
jgi:hypothetical protein